MTQLVKCCMCDYEDVSLDFSKMLGMVVHTGNSSAEQPDTEGSLGNELQWESLSQNIR